jgi:hypothetical protein
MARGLMKEEPLEMLGYADTNSGESAEATAMELEAREAEAYERQRLKKEQGYNAGLNVKARPANKTYREMFRPPRPGTK